MNKANNTSVTNASQPVLTVTTPYGTLQISDIAAAQDHANMRARELNAFLTLISGGGMDNFAALNGDLQNSLLWMASRAAGELDELLSQVSFTAAKVLK